MSENIIQEQNPPTIFKKSSINEKINFVPFRDKMLSLRSESNLNNFKADKDLASLQELEVAVNDKLTQLIEKQNFLENEIMAKVAIGEPTERLTEEQDLTSTHIETIFRYKAKLIPAIAELNQDDYGREPNPLRSIFPNAAKMIDRFLGK